jgi:hypothetical protein
LFSTSEGFPNGQANPLHGIDDVAGEELVALQKIS